MRHMLTTVDNPFDPFDDYSSWWAYDVTSGYNSGQLLARVANYSEDLPPAAQAQAIEQAIDEIVRENVLGVFRKISKE